MRRRLIGLLVAVITAYLSWYAYEQLGIWIESSDPEFLATALLLSIALHEIGHWIAMERHGVMAHVFFAVILGGAVPDKKYGRRKMKSLNWSAQAEIMLAGVAMNVLIVIGTVVLYNVGWLQADQMHKLVNINGGLTLVNLLPFGPLDGGQFSKFLFDSIPEHLDGIHAKGISLAVGTAAFILILFGTIDPITIGLLIYGLHRKASTDCTRGSTNAKAMTYAECNGWAVTYTALVIAGMVALGLSQRIL